MTVSHDALPVEQGRLPLTIAHAHGIGAGVVIIPSAFGVAEDLELQMRELAEDARVVVAFDPFFRGDAGPAAYDDMNRVLARLQLLNRERTYRDLRSLLAWTQATFACPSLVVLGICFGGPHVLHAAADGLVAGGVTWHGTKMKDALGRAGDIRCPLRMHFGSADPFVPSAEVELIREAFATHPNAHVIVHEGASHGFSHRAATHAYAAKAEVAGMDSLRELVRATGPRVT